MKDILHPLVKQFMPFAQKRMGFDKPPRLFLRNDPENARNPLGKTAYYDPEQMSVTLYINGRHPKDIMRSLSHELVHHTQNCNGQFDGTSEMGEGYAQNDEHLREMEREAYEQGNLCFRDWEDSIKGTIYIQNMNVSIQKEGKNKMSLNDWKNNELKTLLSEKWGFSFNLLNESQEEEDLDEGMCQQCAPSPCGCGTMEEGEDKKMVKCGDKGMVPDYACDGEGEDDLESKSVDKKEKGDDKEEKSDKGSSKVPPQLRKDVKGKMDEQKIRRIIRKLVKEAMIKKAK